MTQLTAEYNPGPSRNVSEHTGQQTMLIWGYTAEEYSCAFADQVSTPTTHRLGLRKSQIDHESVIGSCQWPCQDKQSSRQTVAPSMYRPVVAVLCFKGYSLGCFWNAWLW